MNGWPPAVGSGKPIQSREQGHQALFFILYEVDDQAQHVTAFLIGHRKDIYKRLERLG